MITAIDIDKFWARVCKYEHCWIWTGGLTRGGYAAFTIKRKTWRGARFVWTITNGHIPLGLHVLHSCDNRLCVNPSHLFLGTNQDNIDDKVRKNRQRKGETVPNAKLTSEIVKNARNRYNSENITHEQLASELGISRSVLSKAIRGDTWAHVPEPGQLF
jgi:hypothetical protein